MARMVRSSGGSVHSVRGSVPTCIPWLGRMQANVAIGALIGIGFALGWAGAGLQSLPSRWRSVAFGIGIVVSVLIGTAILWRQHAGSDASTTPGTFDGAFYGWTVALETVFIVVAVRVLRKAGLAAYIAPTVATIVGLHFFGLAHAISSGASVFRWVGVSMCVVGVAASCALASGVISSKQIMGSRASAALAFYGLQRCPPCSDGSVGGLRIVGEVRERRVVTRLRAPLRAV